MTSRSLVALVLGLLCAQGASADTLYLNRRGAAQIAQLETEMEGPKVYSDGPGNHYIRCRITGYTPGSMGSAPSAETLAKLEIDAWWRADANSPIVWAKRKVSVSLFYVQRVVHEVDDLFDLRLMIGSRDKLRGEDRPSAPISADPRSSGRWRVRMGLAIDPLGRLGLTPPPDSPEEKRLYQEEKARDWSTTGDLLEQRGWVIERLLNPALQMPERPTPEEAQRFSDQAKAALMAEHDPFLPLIFGFRPEEATLDLLEGAARCARYEPFEQRVGLDLEANRPAPANQEFRKQALVVAALLCSFAAIQPDSLPPAATETDRQNAPKLKEFGMASRLGLIRAIEAAAPGEVSPEDDPAEILAWVTRQGGAAGRAAEERRRAAKAIPVMNPGARLRVDASDVAAAALSLLRVDTFRIHRTDGERLVKAIVRLNRRLPPEDARLDPRRLDYLRQTQGEQGMLFRAKDALLRLVRPDLASASPELAPKLREAGLLFRRDLEKSLLDEDPAIRAFVEQLLLETGSLSPVATAGCVNDLFAAALGETTEPVTEVPAGANPPPRLSTEEEQRRAALRKEQRRYAITCLIILGNLADPNPASAYTREEQSVGRAVIERLEVLRDAIHLRTASRAQAALVQTIDNLPTAAAADSQLRDRAARLAELSRRVAHEEAQANFDRARTELATAIENQEPDERIDALRVALERAKARLDRLRDAGGTGH